MVQDVSTFVRLIEGMLMGFLRFLRFLRFSTLDAAWSEDLFAAVCRELRARGHARKRGFRNG